MRRYLRGLGESVEVPRDQDLLTKKRQELDSLRMERLQLEAQLEAIRSGTPPQLSVKTPVARATRLQAPVPTPAQAPAGASAPVPTPAQAPAGASSASPGIPSWAYILAALGAGYLVFGRKD